MAVNFAFGEVSRLCLGSGDFGSTITVEIAERVLDTFAEAGGNFLDTAHCYAFWSEGALGAPERIIGNWLKKSGHPCVIATKGGHPPAGPAYSKDPDFLSPESIDLDLSESLERLKLDTIDLYYLHRDDGMTPVSEIVDTLNAEVDAGRIRTFGASNWSVARMREAGEYAARTDKQGFSASQPQWSLAEPTWMMGKDPSNYYVLTDDLAWYQASGVPVVPYSATATGYFAKRGTMKGQFESEKNFKRYLRAQKVADELDVTTTQVALAWLIHKPIEVIPIFSTRNVDHIAEAFGSLEVHLSAEQMLFLSTDEEF